MWRNKCCKVQQFNSRTLVDAEHLWITAFCIMSSWSVCKLYTESNSLKNLILKPFSSYNTQKGTHHNVTQVRWWGSVRVCNREVLCSVRCVLTHRSDRVFLLGLDSYRIRRSKLSTGKSGVGIRPEQHMPHKNREWKDKKLIGWIKHTHNACLVQTGARHVSICNCKTLVEIFLPHHHVKQAIMQFVICVYVCPLAKYLTNKITDFNKTFLAAPLMMDATASQL